MIPAQQFTIWLIVLAGLPAIVAAFLSFVGVILTRQNRAQIDTVHLQINSRMDQLISVTAAAAKSEGQIEGREQAKSEKQ